MEQVTHEPKPIPGKGLLRFAKGALHRMTSKAEKGSMPDNAVERLETQGFAREAPVFAEQAKDKTRKEAVFRSTRSPSTPETEYEGLNGLARGLISRIKSGDRLAKVLYEHLTFVGAREYDQAVRGLAAYWKSYLDSDPANKLCIGALITGSEYTSDPKAIKSDIYVLDRILRHLFPKNEDFEKYRGRFFINDLSGIDLNDEAHYKMIFVDDQMLSGNQMAWSMGRMIQDGESAGKRMWPELREHMSRVEINLLAASHNQLQNGLRLPDFYGQGKDLTVKIKAFIRAKKDTSGAGLPGDPDGERVRTPKGYKQLRSRPDADAFITNIYSSSDYDYEYVLRKIFSDGRWIMPSMVEIISSYAHDPGLVSRWAEIRQLLHQTETGSRLQTVLQRS